MRPAFSVAYRILENRTDAQDLVQEAFLTALDRIDTFDTGRPFGPWFYRILWNRGLNAREARSRRQGDPLPDGVSGDGAVPAAAAGRSELRGRIQRALESLTPRQRDIVKLADLEGFSSGEIAEMLELAAGTVRWHLHEARRALREALSEYREDYT